MNLPCGHCGALHWLAEKLANSSNKNPRFSQCCMEGKILLSIIESPPEPLRNLLTSMDPKSALFRDDMWKYNRAFAFTSLGVSEDDTINWTQPDEHGHSRPKGPPVFRICKELYHRSGALLPDEGKIAIYSQLYIYEPRAALETRAKNNPTLDPVILRDLQAMLLEYHQYVPVYQHAYEILRNYNDDDDVDIRLRVMPGLDRHRYNLPTADEVAVILPDNPSKEPRDIVLRLRSGPLRRISDLHPAYVPLQYPLLFPRDDCSNGSKRLTLTSYVAYRLHYRPNNFNLLLRGGRLYTHYLVDMFATADQQRISFILQNQPTIRAAHFSNLEDAVAADPDNVDLRELGQRIILPSSHTGSPRYMSQGFQDAMAIVRYHRKVDIFMTVTTNPHWHTARLAPLLLMCTPLNSKNEDFHICTSSSF
ncbi:hypothetical protein BDN70DRAFT_909035 [Pholiota conissans]|uniref:Helitron helicase-like domain-containing protein n=1 Tax=Pholiota conissans TaxID=109636 RepID=A0A9P5YPP0_9AGAR|nr:hypothetical protein BDN70DRAFT_909035 [Pholiota conissans]